MSEGLKVNDILPAELILAYLHRGGARCFTPDVLAVSCSGAGIMSEKVVTMETSESSEDELGRLDIDLDRKSRQHNLSSSNVRAILHVSVSHTHTHRMCVFHTVYIGRGWCVNTCSYLRVRR